MKNITIDRKKAESKIIKHLRAIDKIRRNYGASGYLSLRCCDNTMSFNNRDWNEGEDFIKGTILNMFERVEE